ncbi:MAG TPA: heme-binding protein, partial [Kineosporiaceae bacterium]|nr:heme-binding protein [Kineosporiaceae bacterium]
MDASPAPRANPGPSGDNRIMIFAGGIPLQRDGRIVGAVGVSGGEGEQDQAVAEAAAAATPVPEGADRALPRFPATGGQCDPLAEVWWLLRAPGGPCGGFSRTVTSGSRRGTRRPVPSC